MKKIFLVANWKSHKTLSEAHLWMQEFLSHDFASYLHVVSGHEPTDKRIIICPPFTLLSSMHDLVSSSPLSLPLKIGAQNVSPFDEGAHTGEEPARILHEFAQYVLIGHSERRKQFNETDEILDRKVKAAREHHIEPIFCVQNKETLVPDGVHIVAYEPTEAIGSGHPEDAKSANEVAKYFKEEKDIPYVLYGGSVTDENVRDFTTQAYLDGVLVGNASLDAKEFSQIIQKA